MRINEIESLTPKQRARELLRMAGFVPDSTGTMTFTGEDGYPVISVKELRDDYHFYLCLHSHTSSFYVQDPMTAVGLALLEALRGDDAQRRKETREVY